MVHHYKIVDVSFSFSAHLPAFLGILIMILLYKNASCSVVSGSLGILKCSIMRFLFDIKGFF